jgi:hypothetical protein
MMVSCAERFFDRICPMPEGLLPILLLIAVVVIYVIAKVVQNMRTSERQWQDVDKSKLKKWEDDD